MTKASTTSKSTLVALRLPNDLVDQLNQFLARSVIQTRQEPYSKTALIIKSLREYLGKSERTRQSRARRKAKMSDGLEA